MNGDDGQFGLGMQVHPVAFLVFLELYEFGLLGGLPGGEISQVLYNDVA